MSDHSARLALPYLKPSQAQKHVTHNEALRRLDVLVQLVVEQFDAQTPPALPQNGRVYAVGSGATGDWAGHDGALAARIDGAWDFILPGPGWQAVARATGALRVWTGSAWVTALSVAAATGHVGINTPAPARSLHVSDVLRLEPATAPASPAAGDLYFDSASARLRCHDGTAWQDLF